MTIAFIKSKNSLFFFCDTTASKIVVTITINIYFSGGTALGTLLNYKCFVIVIARGDRRQLVFFRVPYIEYWKIANYDRNFCYVRLVFYKFEFTPFFIVSPSLSVYISPWQFDEFKPEMYLIFLHMYIYGPI